MESDERKSRKAIIKQDTFLKRLVVDKKINEFFARIKPNLAPNILDENNNLSLI